MANFQIKYNLPYTNTTDEIIIKKDVHADSSNIADKETTASSEVCNGIWNDKNYMNDKIHDERLVECLESFEDLNGLYAIGIKLTYTDAKETVLEQYIQCSKIPSSFSKEWISESYVEQDDSCQHVDLGKPNKDHYDKIELKLFSCDLRCMLEQQKDPLSSDHAEPVQDLKTSTMNEYFTDQSTDIDLLLAGLVVLIIVGIYLYWNKIRDKK